MFKSTLLFLIAASVSEPGAFAPLAVPKLGAYPSIALGLIAIVLARRRVLSQR